MTAASPQAPGLRPRATRPLCPSAEPPAPAGFWVSHEKTPAGVAGFSCLPGNLGCPDGPPGRSASPLFPEPRRRRRVPGDPVLRARAPAGTSHPRAGLGRRTPLSASPRLPGEESRSRHWPCPSAPIVQPAGPWPRVDRLPSHFRLHSGLFPGKARAPPSRPATGTWPLLGQGPLRMSAGLCPGPAGPAAPPSRPPSDAPSKPWPDPDWDEQAVTIPSPARVPDTSKADASSRGPRPGCPLHLLGHQPGCGRRAEFHVQSDPPSDRVMSAVHAFSCPGLRGPGRQPRQPGVPLPAAPPADETLGLRHPCEVR